MPNGILGLILCSLLQSAVLAEGDEQNIYPYRSKVMDASSNHLKALQAYVRGELEIKDHFQAHADALLDLNGMYQDLFPAGKERHPESEAVPSIWIDPRGFQQVIKHNRKRIMALRQIDASDEMKLKQAVNDVRMSCGDCHSCYRER